MLEVPAVDTRVAAAAAVQGVLANSPCTATAAATLVSTAGTSSMARLNL